MAFAAPGGIHSIAKETDVCISVPARGHGHARMSCRAGESERAKCRGPWQLSGQKAIGSVGATAKTVVRPASGLEPMLEPRLKCRRSTCRSRWKGAQAGSSCPAAWRCGKCALLLSEIPRTSARLDVREQLVKETMYFRLLDLWGTRFGLRRAPRKPAVFWEKRHPVLALAFTHFTHRSSKDGTGAPPSRPLGLTGILRFWDPAKSPEQLLIKSPSKRPFRALQALLQSVSIRDQ